MFASFCPERINLIMQAQGPGSHMYRAGVSPRFWPVSAAGRIAVFGMLIFGQIRGTGGAHASDKAGEGEPAPRRTRNVSTALDAELAGPLAYHGRQERAADSATHLDAALDQMRRERDSLVTVRNSTLKASLSETDEVALQRETLKQQINGLMTELARRPKPEQAPSGPGAGRKDRPFERQSERNSKRKQVSKFTRDRGKPADGSPVSAAPAPVDPMALAQALFRTGDYEGALKAFELAKKTTTVARERNVIKYFSAACLKKLGNVSESTMLFREVANSKADDVLAECAQWQLSMQQWRETTVARIEQLRAAQTAEKLDPAKPTAAAETESQDQRAEAEPPAK